MQQRLLEYEKNAESYLEELLAKGQEPREIALVIKKAIEDKVPHQRYQTNDFTTGIAKKRFKDSTGDLNLAEMKQAIDHLRSAKR